MSEFTSPILQHIIFMMIYFNKNVPDDYIIGKKYLLCIDRTVTDILPAVISWMW